MKYILFLILCSCLQAAGQTPFHDLTLHTAYGGQFSLQQYKGQKVVIAAVNISNFKKKDVLQFWDSLQTAHPKIAFVIIPASDHDTPEKEGDTPRPDSVTTAADSAILRDVKERVSDKIVLSTMGKVSKAEGARQHPLMQWLTQVKQNKHFDLDVESDVQIYVISESGELYAVLTKDTRLPFLHEVLQQADVQPSALAETRP